MALRRCGTQGGVISGGFKHRPLEPDGLGSTGELDGHGCGGLAGDGHAQSLVQILAKLVAVIDGAPFDGQCQLLAQQLGFYGVTDLAGLAPIAVYAYAEGLLSHSGPAVFMVDDVGEQGHGFNRFLTRRVGIPSLASHVFTCNGLARKQGHGKDEMHMETCLTRWGVGFFTMQHEQAVELVIGQAGCYHSFEAVNDVEQFGLGWLLVVAEGQTTAGVFVLAADSVDEVNGQAG